MQPIACIDNSKSGKKKNWKWKDIYTFEIYFGNNGGLVIKTRGEARRERLRVIIMVCTSNHNLIFIAFVASPDGSHLLSEDVICCSTGSHQPTTILYLSELNIHIHTHTHLWSIRACWISSRVSWWTSSYRHSLIKTFFVYFRDDDVVFLRQARKPLKHFVFVLAL